MDNKIVMPQFAGIDPIFAPLIQHTGQVVENLNSKFNSQPIIIEQVTPIHKDCPNCGYSLDSFNRCNNPRCLECFEI